MTAFVLAEIAACGGPAAEAPSPVPTADSSIRARDYVGPQACAECHPDEHGRWSRSLHAVMNQRATGAAVIGDFDTRVTYRGGEVTFTRESGTYTMTFSRAGRPAVRYRVTRTIGARGLQEYVGTEDGRAGAPEVRLPFAWWPRARAWFPQPYFDPWLAEADFDAYAPVREPWAERCPWCHSTYPFEQRIARGNVGHGLEQFFTGPPRERVERLDVAQQVTVGISCESCHLGGRAHAAGAPIHFVPLGAGAVPGAPRPTSFAAERRDPAIVNAVCAQCHSGPSPHFPDGSATRNSSEALDLARSSCTGIRCVDCHDPHRGEARDDSARAVAACVRCHRALAPPAAAAAHAGTGHASATCLDCHMPRTVMGIDRFVRTHRISSPADRRTLAAGAPNACNLCHLDRSTRWTAAELALDLPSVRVDLDAPAGELWLGSAEPAVRLVASAAFARSPLGRTVLDPLLRGLDDPLAHVRAWTVFTVEDLLGRRIDFDPRAEPEVRRAQLAALRSELSR